MKLVNAFDELLSTMRPHFKQDRTFERARDLAYASLFTYGRHTITRLICSKNEQLLDWSADYKFYSLRRWEASDLFFEILKASEPHCYWPGDAIVVALDDTTRRKTGKKIPGVATLRDPMSLPYHVNLRPGLRFLQASVIVTPENRLDANRAIPIYFEEAAPAKKPKKNATAEVKEQYKKEQKEKRLSVKGHEAVIEMRQQVDQLPNGHARDFFVAADGSFCNRNFLRDLPKNVIPIVRARKDLRLYKPAEDSGSKGRKKVYGDRLPTPEEIRKDDAYPWMTARVFSAGKYHEIRYKTLTPVLWQMGTLRQPCRLIVIAPLGYRLKKGSKILYREPAYLLIPDVETPVEELLQYYFLRWDIEVNHRDEKSLLGVGDAQVRDPDSVARNPQFAVATYSLLLLASIRAYGAWRTGDYLPLPSWRKEVERRPSTLDILAQFRREIMMTQLTINLEQQAQSKNENKKSHPTTKKTGFATSTSASRSPLNVPVNVISAMLYADG
ncbi:MAG: transposase [bacterium]